MSLKLIQVGLGDHGRSVGSQFIAQSSDFVYAGLVDLDTLAAQAFAAEHKVPKTLVYTDYVEAFRELKAEAVFIAVASSAHYELCKSALENDLHVLVEKPFVLSLEQGKHLVHLASQRGKIIMVSQNYRFFATVLTLKKALQERVVGKPLFIQVQFYYNHKGKVYQQEMEDYMLLEMAVHHVDLVRFLLDSDIVSVRGMTWNYPDSDYRGDPNVNAAYETGVGVRVFYTGSLLAKGLQTPWEGVWRVQCEEGTIHLDDLGEGFGIYTTHSNLSSTRIPILTPERESFDGVLAEFADSILNNREPISSGYDNLCTLAALFATSRSSCEGTVIEVEKDFSYCLNYKV